MKGATQEISAMACWRRLVQHSLLNSLNSSQGCWRRGAIANILTAMCPRNAFIAHSVTGCSLSRTLMTQPAVCHFPAMQTCAIGHDTIQCISWQALVRAILVDQVKQFLL